MSVHKSENNRNKNEAPVAPNRSQTQEDINTAAPKVNLRGGSNGIFRVMNRNMLGENLSAFKKTVDMITQSVSSQTISLEVLPLDSAVFNLHYSAAILCGVMQIGSQKVVSAYTMILEGSASAPRPSTMNINGRSVQVTLTAMNAWDEETLNKVRSVVTESFGDNINLINAGAMVVPEDLDITDENRVWQLIWAAQEAVMAGFEIKYPDQFEHFNIANHIDRQRDSIVAQFAYNSVDGEAVTGLPVRSDISIAISKTQKGSVNNWNPSSFQHQSSNNLLEVNSFVDLVYSPPTSAPAYGQAPEKRIFVPRIVITRINAIETAQTPETFLLALATSRILGDGYAWVHQFTNYAKDARHNIGGIGYRVQPTDPALKPTAFDTSSNTFGQADLIDMVQTLCYATPAFSIDCEDVGPDSWLTGAFVESAHGNHVFTNYLIDAVDNLTGGIFSKTWDKTKPICVSENNRVHLGTYQEDGQLKDIREIDSLAVLNVLGDRGMDLVNQWEATYNDSSSPIELRLDARMNLMDQIVTNVKIRGHAERITFTPDFLTALISSVTAAGLAVDEDGLRTMYGNNTQVGNTFLTGYTAQGTSAGMLNVTQGHSGGQQMHRPLTAW